MVAQCNPKASPPGDVKLRGVAKPAGQEIGGVNFFDESDVVSVPPDPAIGHEQKGTLPALVMTTKDFNKLGDVPVTPITQGGDFSR